MANRPEQDIAQGNRFDVLTSDENLHANVMNGANDSNGLAHIPTALPNADENNVDDSDDDDVVDEVGPPVHQMEFVVTSDWNNSQQSFQLQVDHNRPRGLHLKMIHSKRPKSKTKKLEIFRATINGKRLCEIMNADFATAHENAYTGALKLLFQRSGTVIVREGNKYRSTLIREDDRNERAFRNLRNHPERLSLYGFMCKLDVVVLENYESLRPTFMDNRKTINNLQTAHITYATISLEDGERFNPHNKLHQQQQKVTFPYPPGEPVPPDRWRCDVQINGIELVSESGQTSMQAEAFATRAVMNLFANHVGYFRLGTKYVRSLDKLSSVPFGYKEENFPSLGNGRAPAAVIIPGLSTRNSSLTPLTWMASRPIRPKTPLSAASHAPPPVNGGLSEFQQRCVRSQIPIQSILNHLPSLTAANGVSREHANEHFLPQQQPTAEDLARAEMEALRAAIARNSGRNRNQNMLQQDFHTFSTPNNTAPSDQSNSVVNSSPSVWQGTFNDGVYNMPSNNSSNYFSSPTQYPYSFGAIGDEVRAAELVSRRSNPILNSMFSSPINDSGFSYPDLSVPSTSSDVLPGPVFNSSLWPTVSTASDTNSVTSEKSVVTSAPVAVAVSNSNGDIISDITLTKTALTSLCGAGNSFINSCTRAHSIKYELMPVTINSDVEAAADEYSTLRLIGLADNIKRVKRILSSRLIQHCGKTLQQAVDDAEAKLNINKSNIIERVKAHDADIVGSSSNCVSNAAEFLDNNAGLSPSGPLESKFMLYEQRVAALEDENKALKTAITILTKDRDDEIKEVNVKYEHLMQQYSQLEMEKQKCTENLSASKQETELFRQQLQESAEQLQRERDDREQCERNLFETLGNDAELREKLEDQLVQEKRNARAQFECVVCCEQRRNTVFTPCRHAVVCSTCYSQMRGAKKKCPICQQTVEKMDVVF